MCSVELLRRQKVPSATGSGRDFLGVLGVRTLLFFLRLS